MFRIFFPPDTVDSEFHEHRYASMRVLMAVVDSPVTGVIEGCILKFPDTCGSISYLFIVNFQSTVCGHPLR